MHHFQVPDFLGVLVALLVAAKVMGFLAQKIGQPAVLGELVAGVLVGGSVLGLVDLQAWRAKHDPRYDALHLLAEIGVIILLFEIGLETNLKKLVKVGGPSLVVAVVGVALPFALGYGVCVLLGQSTLVAVVAGAALTATSVGITARVLSDLGRLQEPEGQIILGAAVIDDVIGLIILAVVDGMTRGQEMTPLGVAQIAGVAVGFLALTVLLGSFVVPPLFRWFSRLDMPGTPTMQAVILAFALAWLAHLSGSAVIIGAFAAGLLLNGTPYAKEIEHGVAHLGHLFVPLFFVIVGAFVDVRVFNPFDPNNWETLKVGGLLIVVAVLGKFLAGCAPFWFRGKKSVIGVGMIPRGEVGLIFAQKGLDASVLSPALFSAVTFMVMVTTFMAPPLLKLLFPPKEGSPPPPPPEGVEDLVTEA